MKARTMNFKNYLYYFITLLAFMGNLNMAQQCLADEGQDPIRQAEVTKNTVFDRLENLSSNDSTKFNTNNNTFKKTRLSLVSSQNENLQIKIKIKIKNNIQNFIQRDLEKFKNNEQQALFLTPKSGDEGGDGGSGGRGGKKLAIVGNCSNNYSSQIISLINNNYTINPAVNLNINMGNLANILGCDLSLK